MRSHRTPAKERKDHDIRLVVNIPESGSTLSLTLVLQRVCTAQRWVLNSKDDSSYDRFQYTIDHPLTDERTWMKKLENLVHTTPRENDCIVWVYLFERVNYQ